MIQKLRMIEIFQKNSAGSGIDLIDGAFYKAQIKHVSLIMIIIYIIITTTTTMNITATITLNKKKNKKIKKRSSIHQNRHFTVIYRYAHKDHFYIIHLFTYTQIKKTEYREQQITTISSKQSSYILDK